MVAIKLRWESGDLRDATNANPRDMKMLFKKKKKERVSPWRLWIYYVGQLSKFTIVQMSDSSLHF